MSNSTVANLPFDADEIVQQMALVDFYKQDIDVLKQLSETLAEKKKALFPETSFQKSLKAAGFGNEKHSKVKS
jgi:hypothetical protein